MSDSAHVGWELPSPNSLSGIKSKTYGIPRVGQTAAWTQRLFRDIS